ncbi:MAG: hypothetical protein JW993_16240 [Sedimentisphaerales bacterium]|nr:hypothetical protein [Sedimentisphaerales bacterium]
MKRRSLWFTLGVLGLLIGTVALVGWWLRPPSPYTVTMLPSLGGGDYAVATGMNEKGQVAGFSEVARSVYHLFLWDRAHGMRDLGWTGQEAHINDLGQITGAAEAEDIQQALFWDPNDGLHLLGAMGGTYSRGCEINNRGQIVGSYRAADKEVHAFVWDRVNGMRTLETPGDTLRHANAINDARQIIVWGHRTQYLVTLDEGGMVADCQALPLGAPQDISATRRVVSWIQTGQDRFDLGLWQASSGLQTFPFDISHEDFPKINDAGQVLYSKTSDKRTGLFRSGAARRTNYLWNPSLGTKPVAVSVRTKRGEQLWITDMNNKGCFAGAIQSRKKRTSRAVLLEPIAER